MGPVGSDVDDHDVARVLVRGDPLAHPLLDLRRIADRAGPGLDEGDDLVAEPRVGDPDHRRLEHVGMLVQHLLDLARIDVVAVADDHVLEPVDDEQIPVVVDVAEVAGREPAVGMRPSAPPQ